MPRVLAVLVLLVAGVLSLPLSAAAFDGEGAENWIIPVQLAAMLVVGAVVGVLTPALAGNGASTGRRRVAVGAGLGVVTAVLGVLLFFLLLSGFEGA